MTKIREATLIFFFLSMVLCVLFINGGFASADTFYVDIDNGLDTNAGTAAAPWKTFHYSLSVIASGTAASYILHMAAGTYSKDNGEDDSEIIFPQSNVTIIGAGDASMGGNDPTTILDGTEAEVWTKAVKITGANVIMKGLSIKTFVDMGIEISGGTENEVLYCKIFNNQRGIVISNSSVFKIRNCEIYSNDNDGLYVETSANGEIHQNTIYRHEGAANNGVYVVNCSPSIRRNKIYDNDAGIRVKASNGSTSIASPVIANNVIYETTNYTMNYGILVRGLDGTANPTIYHNSIDGGSGDGIALERTSGAITPIIKYNIITRCDAVGIDANSGTNCAPDYNDVWGNGSHYSAECTEGANEMHQDPQNGVASELASTSPCINTIPAAEEDPVDVDFPGFTRPRPGEYAKDMGAYEYVADVTNNYTMPGGTGVATDYRIFTVPLSLGTGTDMLTAMENVLGTYNPVHWRGFLYTGTSYREFNSSQFASATIKPGMGFWIITTYTTQIPFQGGIAPDGVDFVMDLAPGWHLIALPWVSTQISLNNINVTDGVNTYAITSNDNNLTQKFLWDYTGSGPYNGYVKRDAAAFQLQNNTGYFFKVLGDQTIRVIIPHADNNGQDAPFVTIQNQTDTHEDDEAPPPPPGSEPIPDIKANGQDGPVTVKAGDSVSVSVSLSPGAWNGRNADWWVAAHTPFDTPLDWYTFEYPGGWQYGIHVCAQMPLYALTPSFNVLNMVLPVGDYIFYFAVDGNMDGEPDATWLDAVQVNVE